MPELLSLRPETPRLHLFRHGETDLNLQEGIISGRANGVPLNELGERQAKELGHYIVDLDIDPEAVEIHVSPAKRTMQTFAIAYEVMLDRNPDFRQAKTMVVPDIQELDQGQWQGRLRKEIYTDDEMARVHSLGKDHKSPDGESINEAGARMLRWASSLVTEGSVADRGGTILAFGHGGAIKYFASKLHGWDSDKTYHSVVPNVSDSSFIMPVDEWQLQYLGKPVWNPDSDPQV